MTGMKVETPAGESIGKVKNVLYDKDGRATYAVISYGGKMGMGTKHTAVPWATVSPMIKGDKLLIDRSLLEQAPLISVLSRTPRTASGAMKPIAIGAVRSRWPRPLCNPLPEERD